MISGVPIDGNTIPNSPTVTANFSVTYSRPVFSDLRIDGNFNMGYTDKFWWDLANTPGTAEPDYWLGNARVALGAENHTWQVSLGITNIFGARYWSEYNPGFYAPGQTIACAGCTDLGAAGAPRQVIASVSFKH